MSENDQANVSEGGQQQPQEYIKLKVIGQVFAYFYNQFFISHFIQDANEVHFRVKYGTTMGKLKKAYAERTGLSVAALRYLYQLINRQS